MASIELSLQFQQALQLMETTDRCLFITGKAGTGKSTLLEHFCSTTKKQPVVLAPTGVAALNVKGETIHKFFHFYIDVTPDKIRTKQTKPRSTKIYKQLKTIIIDEISMVRADLLDCIDVFLRMYGPDPAQTFGGVQMIFVGDLYQLPPVVIGAEKEIFSTHYETPYFFSAHALAAFAPAALAPAALDLEIVELEKIYRQQDQTFIDLLGRIRNNAVTQEDFARLAERFQPDSQPDSNDFVIHLTTTNQAADTINERHLDALEGKLCHYDAQINGEFGKEYYPTSTLLQFKVGAQIMMVNNDPERRWVNGSIGVIDALKKDKKGEPYLEVELQESAELVKISPVKWEVFRFTVTDGTLLSEPAGTFTQFPFRLAWAVTIHKSQGKTFDCVMIDMDRGSFAPGQLYVALSRCRSFEGITLKTRIQPSHIRTDARILDFLVSYQCKKAEALFPLADKTECIREAIGSNASLALLYLKADGTQTHCTVTPITISPEIYRGEAYTGMKALCLETQQTRMYRVDRILQMEKTTVLA